jgi:hypothetical protein
MSPLPEVELARLVAASSLQAKYGTTVDRDSAHERIQGRLAAAREAAAATAAREQMSPTTATGMNTMTPAQQRREIERQAREMRAAQKAAEKEAARQRREQAAADRRYRTEQARAARERERMLGSVLRGVFGTILGGRRR